MMTNVQKNPVKYPTDFEKNSITFNEKNEICKNDTIDQVIWELIIHDINNICLKGYNGTDILESSYINALNLCKDFKKVLHDRLI
jgi:hypothetical protein